MIFKKAKGRFFKKIKKKKKKKSRVKVKGFKKKVKRLKERDDFFDQHEQEKIWDRICDKGRKENRDFKDFSKRMYRIRDRMVRLRTYDPISVSFSVGEHDLVQNVE